LTSSGLIGASASWTAIGATAAAAISSPPTVAAGDGIASTAVSAAACAGVSTRVIVAADGGGVASAAASPDVSVSTFAGPVNFTASVFFAVGISWSATVADVVLTLCETVTATAVNTDVVATATRRTANVIVNFSMTPPDGSDQPGRPGIAMKLNQIATSWLRANRNGP
jgi:hypothetical protein